MKILESLIFVSFLKESEQRDLVSLGKTDGEFNVPSWTDELDELLEEELELELQNFENIPEPDYVYLEDVELGKIKVDPESFALVEKMLKEFKNSEIDFEMTPRPTPNFSIVSSSTSDGQSKSDGVTSTTLNPTTTSTTTTMTSTTTTISTETSTTTTSTTTTTSSTTTSTTTSTTSTSPMTTVTTQTTTSTSTTISDENETEVEYLTIDLTGVNMNDENAVRENVNSILANYFSKHNLDSKIFEPEPFFEKLKSFESSFCLSTLSLIILYISLLL